MTECYISAIYSNNFEIVQLTKNRKRSVIVK